jgi:L-malate glycosyltransferase
MVAPTLAILGGHAVQARLLLDRWESDPEVRVRLLPINPAPPARLRPMARVKFVRTAVTQLLYWPRLVRDISDADVVHIFSAAYTSFLLAPLPALLVARALGRPVVLNYHSGEGPDHLRRSPLARRTLRGADAVVVPSRFLAEAFATHGIDAEVIPNGIDTARFAYRERTGGGARILSTRNLEPLYNVACTIRAFQRVQQHRPDATLTVAGDGSQSAALHRLAASLALRGVTFLGRVPPRDMPRIYAEADIYLQTPDLDNMPLSVLEAFASGLPVVSTDAGGVSAMLTDRQHGLLAPLDDDEAAADRVRRLLDDPSLARTLARQAFATCGAYTPDAVIARWRSLYRRLAPEGATARTVEGRA